MLIYRRINVSSARSIVILFILVWCFANKGMAQIRASGFVVPALESINEGYNKNNYYGHDFKMHYGVVANIPLINSWEVSAGILHYSKGGQLSFIDSTGFKDGRIATSVVKSNYICIPILVDIKFFQPRAKRKANKLTSSSRNLIPWIFALSGGVYVGYAYKQKIYNNYVGSTDTAATNRMSWEMGSFIRQLESFEKLYYGLNAGIKVTKNFKPTFGVFIRPNYSYQINNVSKMVDYSPRLIGIGIDVGASISIK